MDINSEWDYIAEERLKHRLSGLDISYNKVFLPTIREYLSNVDVTSILDFGCGTGELTCEIAKMGFNVTGIDISTRSIELATTFFNLNNLTFLNKSLIDIGFLSQFSIVVANMVLMDTEDLRGNLVAINKSLESNGRLIVIITHPSFWPIYWEYAFQKGFNYLGESKIYKTYKTKNRTFNGFKTTHFHRPISFYIKEFVSANFNILDLRELGNPQDEEWYPRFMFIELVKR